MPRVKFLQDFEYKPVPQQTFLYKKGDIVLVTNEIAKKAIDSGKAENTKFPTDIPSGINNTISKFKNKKRNPTKDIEQVSFTEEDIEEEISTDLPPKIED